MGVTHVKVAHSICVAFAALHPQLKSQLSYMKEYLPMPIVTTGHPYKSLTAALVPNLLQELQELTEHGRREQSRARIERLELDVAAAVEECRECARDGFRTASFPVRMDSYGKIMGYSTAADADYVAVALSNRGLKVEVQQVANPGSNGFFVKANW